MAVSLSTLSAQLAALFESPPATYSACAQAWASSAQSYAGAVVPASTTVSAAVATLAGDLTSAFQQADAIPAMETAFAAFAATVGAGMAPDFAATPPAGQVGFQAQFSGGFPATHTDAANQIAGRIDTWFRTGTAVPSGGGSPAPWS